MVKPTYLQTADCWAVSEGVHQAEPPGSGGGAGRPVGRPPSRCALPSRDATACHSEGGGTSRTGSPDRFPHQRRKSQLRELGGQGGQCTHTHRKKYTHTQRESDQTECDTSFFFSFLMRCDTILLGKLDDLNRFMRRLGWQLVNISQCLWCSGERWWLQISWGLLP